MPKYDDVDAPDRHSVYMEKQAVQFLRNFKAGTTLNDHPVFPRMIEAGLYDGLGTLLPIGVYWWELLTNQSYNMFSIGRAFDIFPLMRLLAPDAEMKSYIRLFQMERYPDTQKAWRDYLGDRTDPNYKSASMHLELPDYVITGDGEIKPSLEYSGPPFDPAPLQPRFGGGAGLRHVDDINDVVLVGLAAEADGRDPKQAVKDFETQRDGLDILAKFEAEDDANHVRYWYHPESDNLFTTQPGEDRPADPTVEEMSEEEYASVRDRMTEKMATDDLSFDEDDGFDIL